MRRNNRPSAIATGEHLNFGKLCETQNGDTQIELPWFSMDAYPRPVVDHDRAAREFLARYTAYLRA